MSTPAATRPTGWPRAVVALIAVGALARILLLAVSWNDKLDPDAREYLILARRYSFRHPWSASFREPLWRALEKLAVGPFGYSAHAQRIFTVVISIAVLPVAWVLFRRLTRALGLHERVAVIGLAVVALSAQTIREAPRGLREDFCMLLFLVFATLLLNRPGRFRDACLVAAPIAVLSVVRWELASFAAFLAVVFALLRRASWYTPLLAVVGIAVLSGPWLLANQHKHGSLFYNAKVHATYYWKQEQPQSVRALYRSPPADDPPVALTWGQYYLHYLGPATSAERVVTGYAKVTAKFAASQVVPRGAAVSVLGVNQHRDGWRLALLASGALLLAAAWWLVGRLRRVARIPSLLWETLLIVVLAIAPYAALANFGLEMRVLMFAVPLLGLATGVVLDLVLQQQPAVALARRRRAKLA